MEENRKDMSEGNKTKEGGGKSNRSVEENGRKQIKQFMLKTLINPNINVLDALPLA